MLRILRPGLLIWSIHICNVSGAQSTSGGDTASAIGKTSTQVTRPATTVAATGVTTILTCPSRTVNYITHTLPLQCLRTDRSPHNSTTSFNTTASSITITDVSSSTSELDIPVASTTGSVNIDGTDTSTASATPSSSTEITAESATEDDTDSPLDNANFLSFEEWKRQNLAKLGQSPEDIGRSQASNADRPRPVINNALESLGEESEIDLDFAGFGGAARPPEAQAPSSVSATSEQTSGSVLSRSKDAGKTCKERTNYASFDCSATILKSNPECKSASSVLVEHKDSYMLNVCSASNKFFIVELCNDIQIDTIVLANYEFFSSSFRQFRVSVSDRYPVKMEKWKDLGTFEARNTREIQAFLVENPLIWAKYLRIEFLTQYGSEYYCPVSLLRVHGTTMIEDFRHQAGFAAGDEEEVTLEAEVLATPAVALEHVAPPVETADIPGSPVAKVDEPSSTTVEDIAPDQTSPPTAANTSEDAPNAFNSDAGALDSAAPFQPVGVYGPIDLNLTCHSPTTSLPATTSASASFADDSQTSHVTPQVDSPISTSSGKDTSMSTTTETAALSNTTTTAPGVPKPSTTEVAGNVTSSDNPVQTHGTNSTVSAAIPVVANTTTGTGQDSQPTSTANVTNVEAPAAANTAQSQSNGASNSTRINAAASTSAQAPQPSSQESFFKSFHKRLLQLESNSTLSLQYIEEQSRILRDAFSKVEKRQLSSTTKFLSQLNDTVMNELHGFRQAYDQLWQSTVIELEGQRETYQRELFALSARLTMVADELVWQKRMGIIQSTLLLLCLAVVLFGRSANGTIEMPLMQQMMTKSAAAIRAGLESPPGSPSPDSRSPVSLFRRKLWRASTEPAGEAANLTESEASRPQSKDGPNVLLEPPSPISQATQSDFEDEYTGDSSPHAERRDPGAGQGTLSPKKRKKPKKPPNWPKENGPNQRMKSPLAL